MSNQYSMPSNPVPGPSSFDWSSLDWRPGPMNLPETSCLSRPKAPIEGFVVGSSKKKADPSHDVDLKSLRLALRDCQYDLEAADHTVAWLENEKEKALRKAKKSQKKSEEAHSKMVEALEAQEQAELNAEAEKTRAAELEKACVAARLNEEKLRENIERMKRQHGENLSALRSFNGKMKLDIFNLNRALCDAKAEGKALKQYLLDKEREVKKFVSEKEELMMEKEALMDKVEVLLKLLDETLARETDMIEEEYDKMTDFEGIESWECCEVDETDMFDSSSS